MEIIFATEAMLDKFVDDLEKEFSNSDNIKCLEAFKNKLETSAEQFLRKSLKRKTNTSEKLQEPPCFTKNK